MGAPVTDEHLKEGVLIMPWEGSALLPEDQEGSRTASGVIAVHAVP